jgi:hypothetical protein
MLKQPIIENLAAMRLRLLGMAEALEAQEQDPSTRELSFLERFGLLVDQQWNWRENQADLRQKHIRSESQQYQRFSNGTNSVKRA